MPNPTITKRDIQRIGAYLRTTLQSPGLNLEVPPHRGASVQVNIGGETIGTVDQDDEGDFVITIPVLAEDLPGS